MSRTDNEHHPLVDLGNERPQLARFKSALTTAFAADGPTLIEVREDSAFLE